MAAGGTARHSSELCAKSARLASSQVGYVIDYLLLLAHVHRTLDAIPKSPKNTSASVPTVTIRQRPIITNTQSLPPVMDGKAAAAAERAPAKVTPSRRKRDVVVLPRTSSNIA